MKYIGKKVKIKLNKTYTIDTNNRIWNYPKDIFNGRRIKSVSNNHFLLEGDNAVWLKISDFLIEGINSKNYYEIYY